MRAFLLVWLWACGASSTPHSPEAVPVQRMAEAEPVAEPEPVAAEPPAATPTFGAIDLVTGFVPDPRLAGGRAGGPVDATTKDVACVGFIAHVPGHLLVLRTDFSWLRVMAHSAGDTTLVVRAPDGRVLCNDDFDGFDPAIEGAFTAGDYEVWVGSYENGTEHPYQLGVTELQSVVPSSL